MSQERPEQLPEPDPDRYKRLIENEPLRPNQDVPERREYDSPLPIQQPEPPDKKE